MALHTKASFATICGLTVSNITTYYQRGKLEITIKGDEEFIDDALQQNIDFLTKRLSKKANVQPIIQEPAPKTPDKSTKSGVKTSKSEEKQPEIQSKKPARSSKSNDDGGDNSQKSTLYNIEIDQKELNLKKTQKEIELLSIKKSKLEGEVIPIQPVKDILSIFSKSVTSAFHSAADNLLMRIAKKKNLTKEEMASFRNELIEVINIGVVDAYNDSVAGVKNITAEYSLSKGVGERE